VIPSASGRAVDVPATAYTTRYHGKKETQKSTVGTTVSFAVSTLNVRGLNPDGKRNEIFDLFLNNEKASGRIVFIQETHCADETTARMWMQQWKGPSFWSWGLGNAGGVGILMTPNLSDTIDLQIHDHRQLQLTGNGTLHDVLKHRVIAVLISVAVGSERRAMALVSVYAPATSPSDRAVFFTELLNVHDRSVTEHLVTHDEHGCLGSSWR